MKALRFMALATLLTGLAPTASAFDDNRQGFLLGLGAGLHTIDLDYLGNGRSLGSESESGIATSLKIGGGLTDQFALYFVRNASWYSAPGFNGSSTVQDMTFAVGLTGVGATYFFSPSAPSGYVLGALGAGDIAAPFESNVESDTGSAFMVGGGYELGNHLMLEATLLGTDIDSGDIAGLSLETTSLQFTFNYLFY